MPSTPPHIGDHELVRCIGKGAYGEVWLARNVLGTLRAAKIVYRSKFESDKPLERELQGLRNFEPVSRSHPGLVDVLQVGRNGIDGGCLYYIMELADDAETGRRIVPETYQPRTLASEIARRGRFTLAECAEVGGALAAALAYLHEQGLVHRDIKPSNIIFVDGEPKFADVGLVAILGERDSYLGTAGYIPPEGPGTSTADIFSLGKVLYQMATGNAADSFPELPTGLGEKDIPQVLKLNPIFLKACDPDPRRRYRSASQLRDALVLATQEGQVTIRPFPIIQLPGSTLPPHVDTEAPLLDLRVAILYQSNTQPDRDIADRLEKELTACKGNVFADRNLTVGVDWARTIEARIREADAVIVLLSEASASAEMLAWEVETAHHSREQTGKPILLPVRVQYDGPLAGELGSILEPLKCFRWTRPEDNEPMLEALFEALETPLKPSPSHPTRPPPNGPVPPGARNYVVRPTDRDFAAALERRDCIVLVKGARQMGKTSLLARGLQQARKAGAHVVWTDFQKLNAAQLEGVEPFLQALGEFLAFQLKLDVFPVDVWDKRRGANTNFENYLRREVFARISGHLVWELDEVDRLFSCPFGSEIFALFRSWHNERAADPSSHTWRLTLAIAYATEAHLFITDLNQSPFNVGTRLTLEDFTFEQGAELNGRYGSPLKSVTEVRRLHALLGGQPYLVNRALSELADGTVTFDEFLTGAARDEGIFSDHLRRIVVMLAKDQELADVVRGILQGRPCPSDSSFYRLRSAGVVKGDSASQAQIRCEVYAQYLNAHLK